MYIKNINNWLNENNKDDGEIIFKELLIEFSNNYEGMISWLNQHLVNKKVWFIASHHEIFKNYGMNDFYIVKEYKKSQDNNLVSVYMIDGQNGHAHGLVYLEGINKKKYEKIKRLDVDPYEEEDWGYEEIK